MELHGSILYLVCYGKWKNRDMRYSLTIIFLLFWRTTLSQGHLFSEVNFNKSTVYVGEPVEVTVSVYTSTWFTKGVNPGNIKVNGAFTVYFRSVSSSKKINGKTYAGVRMIYNVFPYDEENIEFPAVTFSVETPDEGGYKGLLRKVMTKPKQIVVKSIPTGFDRANWLVASNLSITEKWSGNKLEVKVGDVLERSIVRYVSGTVSELIPPITWEDIDGVSLYPSRPEVNNKKTKTSIGASRSEGIRYLFEKEGDVVLPELVLTWWDPYRSKLFKRTLNEVTINVQSNPDLGMLASVKESLETSLNEQKVDAKETSFSFLGLNFWELTTIAGLLILLLWVLKIVILLIIRILRLKRQQYLNSELFHFRKFKQAVKHKNSDLAIRYLYRWIDEIDLDEPVLRGFVRLYGGKQLNTELIQIEKQLEKGNAGQLSFNLDNWSTARKNYMSGIKGGHKGETNIWINPGKG